MERTMNVNKTKNMIMMGTVEGFMVAFIKILLKLVVKGMKTAFVGELASLIGTAFVSLTSLIGNTSL